MQRKQVVLSQQIYTLREVEILKSLWAYRQHKVCVCQKCCYIFLYEILDNVYLFVTDEKQPSFSRFVRRWDSGSVQQTKVWDVKYPCHVCAPSPPSQILPHHPPHHLHLLSWVFPSTVVTWSSPPVLCPLSVHKPPSHGFSVSCVTLSLFILWWCFFFSIRIGVWSQIWTMYQVQSEQVVS